MAVQEWKYGKERADRERIAEIEAEIGFRLPEDYVRVALEHHGARPFPTYFTMANGKSRSIWQLHSLNPQDDLYLLRFFRMNKDYVPRGVIPFADDIAGNMLSFDYRTSADRPTIVIVEHELTVSADDLDEEELAAKPLEEYQNEAIRHVCGSFTELLEGLHEE